jgi:hypothetical protein
MGAECCGHESVWAQLACASVSAESCLGTLSCMHGPTDCLVVVDVRQCWLLGCGLASRLMRPIPRRAATYRQKRCMPLVVHTYIRMPLAVINLLSCMQSKPCRALACASGIPWFWDRDLGADACGASA